MVKGTTYTQPVVNAHPVQWGHTTSDSVQTHVSPAQEEGPLNKKGVNGVHNALVRIVLTIIFAKDMQTDSPNRNHLYLYYPNETSFRLVISKIVTLD